MAEKLARMYGTEEDKVNCPFWHKMGACRHGTACERKHNQPLLSPTIILPHLYQNPMAILHAGTGGTVQLTKDQEETIERDFHETFVDIFDEVSKFGEVAEIQVCDNLNDHLVSFQWRACLEEEGGCGRGWCTSTGTALSPSYPALCSSPHYPPVHTRSLTPSPLTPHPS
jgi:splicing factor U2AF subunit